LIGISRNVLDVFVLVEEVVEEGAKNTIRCACFNAKISCIQVSDKSVGWTYQRIVLLGLMDVDGYVEGSRVSSCRVISAPEIFNNWYFGKGYDFEGLIMYFSPLIILDVLRSKKSLKLIG
jgi:hypothetical protein